MQNALASCSICLGTHFSFMTNHQTTLNLRRGVCRSPTLLCLVGKPSMLRLVFQVTANVNQALDGLLSDLPRLGTEKMRRPPASAVHTRTARPGVNDPVFVLR